MNTEYQSLSEVRRLAEIKRVKAVQAKMRQRMGERAYLAHRNEISRRSKTKPEVAAKIKERRRAIGRAETELRLKFSPGPYEMVRDQVWDELDPGRIMRHRPLEGLTSEQRSERQLLSNRVSRQALTRLKHEYPEVWAELLARSLADGGLV